MKPEQRQFQVLGMSVGCVVEMEGGGDTVGGLLERWSTWN